MKMEKGFFNCLLPFPRSKMPHVSWICDDLCRSTDLLLDGSGTAWEPLRGAAPWQDRDGEFSLLDCVCSMILACLHKKWLPAMSGGHTHSETVIIIPVCM